MHTREPITENQHSSRTRRQRMPAVHSQAGFTIVEVLVAVIVLAVGLVAVSGMQTRSIQQSTLSDQMTIRVNAVSSQAETLARLPVTATTFFDDPDSNLFTQGTACEYGQTCEWTYIAQNQQQSLQVRRRITRGYPMPNLAMVEIEAVPQGVTAETAQRRTVRASYVRSLRY